MEGREAPRRGTVVGKPVEDTEPPQPMHATAPASAADRRSRDVTSRLPELGTYGSVGGEGGDSLPDPAATGGGRLRLEQKLVTVALTGCDSDGQVREHLGNYLSQGWRVVSVTPFGVAGGGKAEDLGGWIVVVLERNAR